MGKYKFPKGFLWGAATSSHQVEGGNNNDWSEWEKAGHVRNQEVSGLAADHWNRYEEDFDLLEKLNLNSYRFSIEWSRIEPYPGEYDETALLHYRQMITSLRKRGIEPIVTLHHFTNPVWLKDWTKRENITHFVKYVDYVVRGLGEDVRFWCTINEPMNVVLLGYGSDIWPPQYKSIRKGLKAARNFAKAHNHSYHLIHNIYKQNNWGVPLVSIPVSIPYFAPNQPNFLDKTVNSFARRIRNHYFLKKVSNHSDYIALNYYHTLHTRWNSFSSLTDISSDKLELPKNDMGWNIEPEGLFHVLDELYRGYKLPIMITENGIPDKKDVLRRWYIVSHLQQVAKAIHKGVHVIGYQHWSLIDNFEWADGYHGRFGLVAVDFETQVRTIRDSAYTYAEISRSNEISEEIEVNRP